MRIVFAGAFLFLGCTFSAQCQDQLEKALTKKSTHYFGIQANQLFRQLISTGSPGSITNPYLLSYAVNSNPVGTGFTAGLGYTFNQFNDGDAITLRESTQSDFFLRLGLEKKSFWGEHWIWSFGVDVVVDAEKNKTVTSSNFGGSSSKITTERKTNRTGLGPRITINYVITDRLIIGTEASYYFKAATEKITDPSLPTGSENKFKSLNLSVPAVLFLIIKSK